MAKLEGYSKVAAIRYDGYGLYYFALFDDGVNYEVGDTVVVTGRSDIGKIEEIISIEEAAERWKKNITAEVICKVDVSAYEKRVEQRKEKEKLKKQLDKRKREIQERLDNEYYAAKDEVYAALLKAYEGM